MPDDKKPKSTWSDFKDLIENANKLAGLVATVIAVITFASGNRLLSYFFILIACVSIDFFLWRLIAKPPIKKSELLIATHGADKTLSVGNQVPAQRRVLAMVLVTLVSSAGLGWIGYNAWQDYGQWQASALKAQGYIAPTATPNELLVLIADFDQRGTYKYSVWGWLEKPLTTAIKDAGISNVRIIQMPAVKTEDDARRLGTLHKAVFVIWGWYDDAGFNSNFTIIRESKKPLENVELKEIPAELHEFNLYISKSLPAQMSYFATFTVGQLYYWDDKIDDALRAFDVAVANFEQSPKVEGIPLDTGASSLYFFRGVIQEVHRKNLNQAFDDYTKAIKLESKYAAVYYNRGNISQVQGKLDQAIADYDKAVDLDPKDADAYGNRGVAYAAKGNLDQAIKDYNKAIELDPKDAFAYNNRGNVYSEKGDLDKAIDDYNKAIELNPKYAIAYNNRGGVYVTKGNSDQAIDDFNKVIELDPVSLQTWLG